MVNGNLMMVLSNETVSTLVCRCSEGYYLSISMKAVGRLTEISGDNCLLETCVVQGPVAAGKREMLGCLHGIDLRPASF